MAIKQGIRNVMRRFGYEIRRLPIAAPPEPPFGKDPFRDMRKLTSAGERPVVFDVGANVGQTIGKFRAHFADPEIHAFEPGPDTFAQLELNTADIPRLHRNNIALGSQRGSMPFFENSAGSQLNSLLEKGSECWGETSNQREVEVLTVDDYCRNLGVGRIDILKTDTQGFDLEVIRGAKAMIGQRAIQQIYMEIIFSDMYKHMPRLDEIYAFLADNGFVLVTFYGFYYWGNKASWTEALFIHPEFIEETTKTVTGSTLSPSPNLRPD